jgi:hypothetical protein
MAVKERKNLRKAQAQMVPKDDLTPYMGRWVALRKGRVVADADTAIALRALPEVDDSDVVVPVSRSHGGYFVA